MRRFDLTRNSAALLITLAPKHRPGIQSCILRFFSSKRLAVPDSDDAGLVGQSHVGIATRYFVFRNDFRKHLPNGMAKKADQFALGTRRSFCDEPGSSLFSIFLDLESWFPPSIMISPPERRPEDSTPHSRSGWIERRRRNDNCIALCPDNMTCQLDSMLRRVRFDEGHRQALSNDMPVAS